jgi:hypothetical protein
MHFDQLPDGAKFLDIDGRAVAVLPNATHLGFTR